MATNKGFQFKLDPSSLPKLSSRGDNFSDWKSAWKLTLSYAGLWTLVNGSRQTKSTDGDDDWDEDNTRALVMLMGSVQPDITSMVTSHENAAEAWSYLVKRFDRDTGDVAIHLFRSITNLRYHDGEDLRQHVDTFHDLWSRMSRRCLSSKQAVSKAMRPIFESDEVKGSVFLTTLPDTMDHIIESFAARDVVTFIAIQPKILDIAEKHYLDTVDSSGAFYTMVRRPAKGKQPKRGSKLGTNSDKECTWCRKHNLSFTGHIFTDCRRLKQHQADRGKSQPKYTANEKRQNQANTVTINGDSDDLIVANACTAKRQQTSNGDQIMARIDPALATTSDFGVATATVSAFKTNASAGDSISSAWLFDSGASRHMSGQVDDFCELSPRRGIITIAGGMEIPIDGIGRVRLQCKLPNGTTKLTEMTGVLYSKQLRSTRLFSWPYVRDKGFTIYGKGNDLYLLNTDDSYAIWSKFVNGAMEIQTQDQSQDLATHGNFASYQEFHEAIGHNSVPNPHRLHQDAHLVPAKPTDFHCETCSLSKSTRSKPQQVFSPTHSTKAGNLIHTDLSGSFSTQSLGGARYFISFIDDATRMTWVRLVKCKSETPTLFKEFVKMLDTQYDIKVRRVRSDNGGEYLAKELDTYFKLQGIVHEPSPPYSHESNGMAERFNRTIVTMARSMIQDDTQLPLWAEAIKTATFIKNISPHAALLTTPYEAFFQKKPQVARLHPFGQRVYAHIHKEARKPGTKLLHRAEKGIFVGYGKSIKICRVYVPDRNNVFETRDVTFKPFQRQKCQSSLWQLSSSPDLAKEEPTRSLP